MPIREVIAPRSPILSLAIFPSYIKPMATGMSRRLRAVSTASSLVFFWSSEREHVYDGSILYFLGFEIFRKVLENTEDALQ